MTKFLLFIIILNFLVVIYNFYMWFTVQKNNKSLEKENEELRYYLNLEYKENFIINKILNDIENKKD